MKDSSLQRYGSDTLKKQSNKLSLQMKFSQINTCWYQSIVNSPKNKNLNSPLTLKKSYQLHKLTQSFQFLSKQSNQERNSKFQKNLQDYQDFVEKLQRKLYKSQTYFQYQKSKILKTIDQLNKLQIKRRNTMKQQSQTRLLKIQSLRKQCFLILKYQKQQQQRSFIQLQQEFNTQINKLTNKYKQIRHQWKTQIRQILQKIQGSPSSLQIDHQKLYLHKLQKQSKQNILNQQKKLQQIELQMIRLGQSFREDYQRVKNKSLNKFVQSVQQVRKLQLKIKEQVRKEHWMAEENREKLLYLFQNSQDKINNQSNNNHYKSSTNNNYISSINKISNHNTYKPSKYNNHFKYRHQLQG